MAIVTRHWADVHLDNVDDRVRLQPKALFFAPRALEISDRHKVTTAALASTSGSQKRHGNKVPFAGKAVIQNVLACQPVSHDSMSNFINLVNFELGANTMTFDDVVACVFRLRAPGLSAAMGVSVRDIQSNCRLTAGVVQSALAGMRITYNDARAIWAYLMSVKSATSSLLEDVHLFLTQDQRDFIGTDAPDSAPIAIHRIGTRNSDRAEYVYNRYNLSFAPRAGHPWALEVTG